jgi:prepilin-type N-terminal cleavage/methylation domain-containing protein
MKLRKNKAFTLVELLVVITILAIISVVAYQNFGWAVDKANTGRKISDVSTIETALQQYKADKNYYPSTQPVKSATNLWWYDSTTKATPSNKIIVTLNWEEIQTVKNTSIWGWKVYWTWAWADWQATKRQIWAKWIISQETLTKKYLSKDLYDPELGDIKVNDIDSATAWDQAWKMIDLGIGRYVYATYKKNKWNWDWAWNYNWINYNIAYTVKKEGSDKYITKIVWDYDKESCYEDKDKCPDTLIWLTNGSEENWNSNQDNYGVPYAITDFAQ